MPRINVVIAGDATKLNKAMAASERRMRRFAGGLQSIGGGLFASIGAPMLAIGAASVNTAARFERMEKGLEAIMGSSEDARVELEKLRKLAQGPGLSFEQAVRGSVKLQAVGFSAEQARKTLEQFGNALSLVGGTAADLDGVSLALTQIVSKGKVSAEEINQIAERVPQIRAAMQDAFKTADTEKIQKMGLSSVEFVEKVTESLAKLPRASNTVSNSFDNLRQSADGLLNAIGKTLIEDLEIQRVVESATNAVNKLGEAFRNMSPFAKDVMYTVAGIGTIFGGSLWVGGKIVGSVASLSKAFRDLGGAKLIASIVTGFKALTKTGTTANIAIRMLGMGLKALLFNPVVAAIAAAALAFEILDESMGEIVLKEDEQLGFLENIALGWRVFTGDLRNVRTEIGELKKVGDWEMKSVKLTDDQVNKWKEMNPHLNQAAKNIKSVAGETKQLSEEQLKLIETRSKIMSDLKGEILMYENLSKVLNETYEEDKISAFESAIQSLLRTGLDPMDYRIQSIKKQMDALYKSMMPVLSAPELIQSGSERFAPPKEIKSEGKGMGLPDKLFGTGLNSNEILAIQEGKAADELAKITAAFDMASNAGQRFADIFQEAAEGTGSAVEKMGKVILNVAKEIIKSALLSALSQWIASSMTKLGIFGVPIAGAGFGIIQGLFNKGNGFNVPALAQGGMTTSAGYAMIGDNPSGKEFVIPYEKMGDFARRALGGSNSDLSAQVVVKGSDLVLVLERENRKLINQRGYGLNQ